MLFVIAQIVGFIAWLIYLYSYYRENTDKIIKYQLISSLFYCLNYLLLGAWTGNFTIIIELVRDYLYYKTDKDDLIFYLSVPIYIIVGIFFGNGYVSLFPLFASLIDGFTLTKKRKIAVFGGILSSILWVIYEVIFRSYSVALTDCIIIISNLYILIFRNNIKPLERRCLSPSRVVNRRAR